MSKIYDFVKKYRNKKPVRLHMPGHKGVKFLGLEDLDITEIDGADCLYNSNGIIAESQTLATKIFNTQKTVYSCEGSSLSIRAMVYLTKLFCTENNKPTKILAFRNVHKSFVSALALCDVEVDWIGENLLSCKVDLSVLESKLIKSKATALYLTSPDYLGYISEIEKISTLCHKLGVLLLVDNAHGAYLKFLPNSHPIDLGADIVCDSAHKTLPVLTGGGYLHIGKDSPKFLADKAEMAMGLFASTSPSYLVMQSLDIVNDYLEKDYQKDLDKFLNKLDKLKTKLSKLGYVLLGNEPLKITIDCNEYGYFGEDIANILVSKNIIPEFFDKNYLVFMFTPQNTTKDINRLLKALKGIKKQLAIEKNIPNVANCKKGMSIKDALFSPSELLPVEKCVGRILAHTTLSCPPAIPIAISGEVLNKKAIQLLKYYGIKTCYVVKNKT